MKTDTGKKILDYIKKHKKARPHDLLGYLQLSEMAIHKQLRKLLMKKFIVRSGSPPLTFYSLPIKEENIKKTIKSVLKKHGIKKASLFGSYARNDAQEKSDVDILVDYPKNKGFYDFVGLKLDLEEALHKEVDLVEFNQIKPPLRHQILSEQVYIL